MRKSAIRAIKINVIFGAIAFGATLLFCTGVMPSVEHALIPIDAAPLKLFGHAKARFNRIELGEEPGGFNDWRPIEMQVATPFMLSYQLAVRKMGQLTVSAVFADGREKQLALFDASDFWPNAGMIVDGRPVTMTVYVGRDGLISVNIESESRALFHGIDTEPYGTKIEFEGGDIALLDAKLLDADLSADFMDERGNVLDSLRPGDDRSALDIAWSFSLPLMLVLIFIFRFVNAMLKRVDAASYIVLFGGMALAATSRQYAPAPFAIALMTVVSIKIAFVMCEKSQIKWYVLFTLLPVALSAVAVISGLAPASTILVTFAAALTLALQETIRRRKQIKASQALSLLMFLAFLICLEGAVHLHFPHGRILRGISEDIFWSMLPKETSSYQMIGRNLICQGKVLDAKPYRDRPAVVLMGGSVMFGSSVNPEMNPADLIQESVGERAEIYNAGLAGVTSFEILENFKRNLVEKKPQIVLVYLLHNDIFQAGPLTKRQIHSRRQPAREIRSFLGRSFLYRYMAEKTARWKDNAGAGRCSDEAIVESFNRNLDDLAEAVAIADGKLILVPEEVRVPENMQDLADELRQSVMDMGKHPGIITGAVYIPDEEPTGEINFTDSCHLTRTGYRRMADGLTKLIIEALNELP